MKLLKIEETSTNDSYDELLTVLEHDGIICFPAESNYRLGASALSVKAVNNLIAAKRRSSHAPSLVFLSNAEMLDEVDDGEPGPGQAPIPDVPSEFAVTVEFNAAGCNSLEEILSGTGGSLIFADGFE